MEDIIKVCMDYTDAKQEVVEAVLKQVKEALVEQFMAGQSVDLGDDFGSFIIKKSEQVLSENSPRTPKLPKYNVVFKASPKLKRQLKIRKEYSKKTIA